ncbi:MAG TPA: hypothetical protein DDZ51_28510 [Planctomycetaceae bacterium]|nr:hypothetical protein [Planctomycetaceae bacterium]
MRLPIRIAAYLWASPNTCVGIALGLVLGGKFAFVDGVFEIHGPRISKLLSKLWVSAAAMTLGHAVLGQSAFYLHITRSHERVHVRQYERWGPLFIPTYLILSAALFAIGKDGYRSNPFEIEAFEEADVS